MKFIKKMLIIVKIFHRKINVKQILKNVGKPSNRVWILAGK